MAMSAYYLKGIAPKSLQLGTIFLGCLQFLVFVFVTMLLMHTIPATWQWLPDLLYGN
jgi:TRAP-type mannitol/chloroaromatic compound transport system permease large subunit